MGRARAQPAELLENALRFVTSGWEVAQKVAPGAALHTGLPSFAVARLFAVDHRECRCHWKLMRSRGREPLFAWVYLVYSGCFGVPPGGPAIAPTGSLPHSAFPNC
jgi:hypothetical protein